MINHLQALTKENKEIMKGVLLLCDLIVVTVLSVSHRKYVIFWDLLVQSQRTNGP
jgi:hypothetical protein